VRMTSSTVSSGTLPTRSRFSPINRTFPFGHGQSTVSPQPGLGTEHANDQSTPGGCRRRLPVGNELRRRVR
jgi:hypothetical protein